MRDKKISLKKLLEGSLIERRDEIEQEIKIIKKNKKVNIKDLRKRIKSCETSLKNFNEKINNKIGECIHLLQNTEDKMTP